MNGLGYMYYAGEGVETDYTKALEWFEKAAELGDETAKENAEAMRQLMQFFQNERQTKYSYQEQLE